ncbi:DegT/DnrJ/EryC1/StrS family aminotransferase, partial [bacterium]|nr:DegT/DnrJ/EryC1/StrS family aminotransferase [bacterium]
MNQSLALFGGPKTVTHAFTPYRSMGPEEAKAAKDVVDSGVLSNYLGAWTDQFYGGPKVLEFEKMAAEYFGVKHAVTVNSWTSGLMAAVGALDIEPGDEIIVSPWTMCASATAIVNWNAIPVFADIDPVLFTLDPKSVEANITPHTRAILSVDIFGQSAPMEELNRIARRHGLKIISDTAQAPGAKYQGKFAGTLGDIGGYSLNYHKHIHTGEGGIAVTNDDLLAERLQMIRNHAEAVAGPRKRQDLYNLVGYNFRLGEIECAIGIEQLKKLSRFVDSRQKAANRLIEGLKDLEGLTLPQTIDQGTHVYYMFPLTVDTDKLQVSRQGIREALVAEGVPGLGAGYQNIHLLPMYQNKIAYGKSGYPWTGAAHRDVDYRKGICPVAERLHENTFLSLALCMYEFNERDTTAIV